MSPAIMSSVHALTRNTVIAKRVFLFVLVLFCFVRVIIPQLRRACALCKANEAPTQILLPSIVVVHGEAQLLSTFVEAVIHYSFCDRCV